MSLTHFLDKLSDGGEGGEIQGQQLKLRAGKLLGEKLREVFGPLGNRPACEDDISTPAGQFQAHFSSDAPISASDDEPTTSVIRFSQVLFTGRVIPEIKHTQPH